MNKPKIPIPFAWDWCGGTDVPDGYWYLENETTQSIVDFHRQWDASGKMSQRIYTTGTVPDEVMSAFCQANSVSRPGLIPSRSALDNLSDEHAEKAMTDTSNPRPRLTSAVVRGLRQAASCVSSELEIGDDGAFQRLPESQLNDVRRALEYMYSIATWHEEKNK